MALEKGPKRCGTWREEEIDILKDYREAFGTDPPHTAGIVIMNDSDDTGEKSVSHVRFIEISKASPDAQDLTIQGPSDKVIDGFGQDSPPLSFPAGGSFRNPRHDVLPRF